MVEADRQNTYAARGQAGNVLGKSSTGGSKEKEGPHGVEDGGLGADRIDSSCGVGGSRSWWEQG